MIGPALENELRKLLRARISWVAALVLLFGPALLAAGLVVSASAGGSDATSRKAQAVISGTGWSAYLDAVLAIYAAAGLLGTGVLVGWCFGREFADQTIGSLYACAVGRGTVACAKFIVLTVWSAVVSALLVPAVVLVGFLTGQGRGGAPPDAGTLGRLGTLALLTGVLALTVAPFASVGRGYLAAFGGLLGLVIAGQVGAIANAGGWFPYAIPGLWALGVGEVPALRLVIVPLTALFVGAATVWWWRRALLA